MSTIESSMMSIENSENNEIQEFVCANCGSVHPIDEVAYQDDDGNMYCEDCVDTCEYCGCVVPRTEAIYANATIRWLDTVCACQDCADRHLHRCRDCEEWFTDDGIWDYYLGYDSEPVCHHCEENGDYVRCADCDVVMDRDDAYYDEDRDAYFCETHYHPRSHHMHDYGHDQFNQERDPEMFLSMDDEPETRLYFGVELEVDDGESANDLTNDLYDLSEGEELFRCKHDGSLGCEGVEIVTRPMTFDYAMNAFPWDELSGICVRNGYRSHDAGTCGLHIHVSRKALGESEYQQDLTTAKLMILLDRFWPMVVRFSRRRGDQLQSWSRKSELFGEIDIEKDTPEEIVEKCKDKDNRYQAININPKNTIEFRVFRGSLNVNTIRATIQFVNVAVNYALRATLREVVKVDWMTFVRSDYEELNEYLKLRKLWFEEEKPDASTFRENSDGYFAGQPFSGEVGDEDRLDG